MEVPAYGDGTTMEAPVSTRKPYGKLVRTPHALHEDAMTKANLSEDEKAERRQEFAAGMLRTVLEFLPEGGG